MGKRLPCPEPEIKSARSPHLHGCDIAGLATGAFFRRGERALLTGHYLTAHVATPTGYDGRERRRFDRRRLLRHTRTTHDDAFGSFGPTVHTVSRKKREKASAIGRRPPMI
jgi:hypothetical protein